MLQLSVFSIKELLFKWMGISWLVIAGSYKTTDIQRIESDIVCKFDIIYVITYIIKYQLIKCYWTKIIIQYINVVMKPPRILTIYFLSRNIS